MRCSGYHFLTDLQCGLVGGHDGEHVAICPPGSAHHRARVAWLEDGRIRRLGPVSEVRRDVTTDLWGELRGTPADAHDFASECSRDWGVRVTVRVDEPRADLPTLAYRPDHDGPTWVVRPVTRP